MPKEEFSSEFFKKWHHKKNNSNHQQITSRAMAKKFGLIKMQGFAKGAMLGGQKPKAKSKPTLRKPVGGFGADEDNDDEDEMANLRNGVNVSGVNKSIAQLQKQSSQTVAKMESNAFEEDPTIYQYDEVYDDINKGKDDRADQRKKDFDPSFGRVKKESRYITSLKKSADIRKVDDQRVFQMKLKKEADAEAHIYGDKEKFVTTAYKEKLTEMGRWKEEDARLSALEEATTVEGKKSMTGFYANLLTKNLAMGSGDVDQHATSAYTIGSRRNEHIRALGEKHNDKANDQVVNDQGEDDIDLLLQKTEESEKKRKRIENTDNTPAIKIETPQEIKLRKEKEEIERVDQLKRDAAVRENNAKSARERFLARKKAKQQ